MKLLTTHAASSYGMPVFLDDDGGIMDYASAIRKLCILKGWTYQDLADKCGVSKRTAEGWGQGRLPSKSALLLISNYL